MPLSLPPQVRQLAAAVRQGAGLADISRHAGRRAPEVVEPGLDRVWRGRHGRRRQEDEHGGVRQAQHQGSNAVTADWHIVTRAWLKLTFRYWVPVGTVWSRNMLPLESGLGAIR